MSSNTQPKGASMALTLVITGVILIMVAITVISFTGSSLGNLFGFGESQNNIQQCRNLIRQWCQQSEFDVGVELNGTDDACNINVERDSPDELNEDVSRDDCRANWESDRAPNWTLSGGYTCKQHVSEIDPGGDCPVEAG